jgi:hypothetical protein
MRGFVVAKSLGIRQLGFNMQENIQQAVELSGSAAATALLILAIETLTTAAAQPDRVEARFEVYGFGGLLVLTNRTTVARSRDGYTIATDLASLQSRLDMRWGTLSADDHQNFTGSSQLCEVKREDLAVNPDRNEDTYQKGKIWYARLTPAGHMMPVRMEYTTAFGVVSAYLAELRADGVDLRLARE